MLSHSCAHMLPRSSAGIGAWSGTRALPYFAWSFDAHVAVELVVERLHVVPEALDVGLEVGGRHVVAGAPERADVVEADLPRALVRELDVPRELVLHRRGDRMPAAPRFDELVEVAALAEDVREVVEAQARGGLGRRRALVPVLAYLRSGDPAGGQYLPLP